MKRMMIINALAMILLIINGTAPVLAGESVNFQAVLNQSELVSISCPNNVCSVKFQGSGAANIIGPTTWTFDFVQDFNITPCNPYSGVMTIEGATGTITLSDTGSVCLPKNSNGPAFISGTWVILSGTGEFEGITGSGASQGVIANDVPVGHYSGTVSY